MPLAPQITNNPDDIPVKDFAISAVTYTSSTATYTATGHTFASGDTVIVSGLAPDGYNGTFVITSIATNTFTVANSTNAAVTDAAGNAYSVDNTDYDLSDTDIVYKPNNEDVTDLINTNQSVAAAYAAAIQAQSDAATAIANAATAYAQANTATFNAGVAQSTADGKNKVHYSTSGPSGSGTNGDIWFVLNGSQNVTAQYTYQSGSWVQNQITSTVIANLDAGRITSGTITSIAMNNGSGTFSVDASGNLIASSATITGTIYASSGTFTGTVTATSGTFTGTVQATSGYLGSASTGWNFASAGYMYNNALTTILYPSDSQNVYALITNRAIEADNGYQAKLGCNWDVGGSTISNSYWRSNARIIPGTDNSFSNGASSLRWSVIYAATGTINTSDERIKTDIKPTNLGLNFIEALNPVSYKFKIGTNEYNKETGDVTPIPGVRTHYGLIAQEVKAALDQVAPGQDFAGWVLTDVNDPDSEQGLRYESFISPLIKAVQELNARVKQLEGK